MNRNVYRIEIDRLVLDGLEITPGQAKQLHPLLEAELARRLEPEGLVGLRAQAVSRWVAPPVQFDGNVGMERLATDLAASVAEAIGANVTPAGEAGDV